MSYRTASQHGLPRLKHASGYVLKVLRDHAVDGMCALSYDDIAALVDYSPRAVKSAVRMLIEANLVQVTRRYGEKRNVYVVEGAYVCAQTSA